MTNDAHDRSRRVFLKSAALAGASGAAAAIVPTPSQSTIASAQGPTIARPSSRMVAVETSNPAAAPQSKSTHAPGADVIADVIKSLQFDYILANPAASFRGLHESLINYGNNTQPELCSKPPGGPWITSTCPRQCDAAAETLWAMHRPPAQGAEAQMIAEHDVGRDPRR